MNWALPTSRAKTSKLGLHDFLMLLYLSAGAVVCGCGGGGASVPTNTLPQPQAPTTKNAYIGTQNPGLWSLTLDDTAQNFSYEPITYAPTPNPATQGSFSAINGILDFGLVNGDPAGMAIEIPSRTAVLRPGDDTTAPVAMVQQSACFAINGNVRFIFVGIPAKKQAGVGAGSDAGIVAYGTIVLSTSADGSSWQFTDWNQYQLPLTGRTPAGTPEGDNPLSFSGTCMAANSQATVTANANAAFSTAPTFAVNLAGYFFEDVSPSVPADQIPYSWLGIAMPSSPLTAAGVASGNYAGFVYEPNNPTTAVVTQPVAFAPTSMVSGSLTGGTYPSDDLTQPPGSQYTIALGSQDSVLNGVFPNATLTMPDPQFYCATNQQTNGDAVVAGLDANGNPVCTTAGVAIVGNPEGQYVIYFSSLDGTIGELSSSGVGMAQTPQILQMYLYQQ